MPLPKLSKQAGELLRKTGIGRCLKHKDSALTINYSSGGGDGLMLHAQVQGQPVRLWLASDQWCQWIKPMLEIPGWHSAPPELHELLACWTLASVECIVEDENVAWPVSNYIEPATIKKSAYWSLHIEYEGRHLDAWLTEAPLAWLESLADILEAIEPSGDTTPSTVPVSLIAGWSHIDQQTLKHLKIGDGLLLQNTFQTTAGELCLFINRPLATLSAHPTAPYILKVTMEDFDDWLDIPADTEDSQTHIDFPVTIVVQVATVEVQLHQLAHLRKGDIIDSPIHMQKRAILKISGRTIGYGMLLEIDGRLAVRIDNLA